MDEEIQEATKYLYGCLNLEKEVNRLYVVLAKKLPCPQMSIITTAIVYDGQKHIAVIKEALKPLLHMYFSPEEISKEFKKAVHEVTKLHDALIVEDNIEDEDISELVKTLTNIEDCLHDFYEHFRESKFIEDFTSALSGNSGLTTENLKYILQTLKHDNSQHREMLIDSLYFKRKNDLKNKDTTPIVRYQNPNAWVSQ
jgi:hypothetical protein